MAAKDIGEILALLVFLIVGLFAAAAIEALRVSVDELGIRNKELKSSETRYRAILNTAVDAIIVIDEQAIVQSFNPAAEKIFGYSSHEVIGKNVKMLMPPSEAQAHDAYVHHYLETGERKIIGLGREVTGMTKLGMLIPLELSIAEWFDSSNKRFFTGIMRDISARKQNELILGAAQEDLRKANEKLQDLVTEKSRRVVSVESQLFQAQKLEAVGQAVTILAHDFRNILSPILSAAELLTNFIKTDNAKIASLLDIIVRTGNDGRKMIEDVLSFVHKKEPKPQKTNVNDIIGQNEKILKQLVKQDISLQFNLASPLPDTFADPQLLQRAILNMVTNARDAMPRGGIITIKTTTEELQGDEGEGSDQAKPGKYVKLTVTDTGSGMTPEVLSKIFEPFFTTKPIGQGTGLGLPMIMNFVRLSGGRMTVQSNLGMGTSINIYLPALA